MTARQIIDEFHKLPPDEQAQVRTEIGKSSAEVTYIDPVQGLKLAKKIFQERPELFRTLAE